MELVELSGYFRKWVNPAETQDPYFSDEDDKLSIKSGISVQSSQVGLVFYLDTSHFFVSFGL